MSCTLHKEYIITGKWGVTASDNFDNNLINSLEQMQSATTSSIKNLSHFPFKFFVLYYTSIPPLITLNPCNFLN